MRLIAIALLLTTVSATSRAADTDSIIARADALIETAPDSAIAICDSLYNGGRLSERQKALTLHTLGNACFAKGDMPRAIDLFSNATDKARECGDSLILAAALSDLGVSFRVSGNTDSALVMYNQALTVLEQLDAPAEEASLLTSIAVLYANQGRFDESIRFGRRAFDMAKQSNDIETIMYAGQTLGIVLYLKGDKEEGLTIEREMVTIAENRRLPRYILKTYASIIDMHYKDGNSDSVDIYIARGQQILPQVAESSVEALGFLEESYVVLTAYGRYRESLELQQRILSMHDAGTFMPMDKLHYRMARNYRGLGDIERMADSYERSIAISDSLHGLEINRQLSEFDVKYQTAQKELHIMQLEAANARQQLSFIIIGGIILIAAAATGIYMRMRRLRTRREAEIAGIRAQLDAVDRERARIAAELHDGVCSDLTGVQLLMQSRQTDQTEIIGIIQDLRDEVRSISHNLMPPRFDGMSLSQLFQYMALRSDGFISFTCEDDVETDSTVSFQLYRIAQEWIQNIRKHSGATHVAINLSPKCLTVTDNGGETPAVDSNGIGRSTISRRIRAIGALMNVTRSGGTNTLTIEIK